MQANQIVVFPDKDTTEYFKKVFASCPFDVDIDSFHVVLNETKDFVELDPNRIYTAQCGLLGYWYDEGLGGTSLILPLVSESLLIRMAELRVSNGAVFHAQPLAFMVIKSYMPPLSRAYRNFVVSVSDILLANEQPLIFTGETQAFKEFEAIPNFNYYEDQLNG